jgi:transposase
VGVEKAALISRSNCGKQWFHVLRDSDLRRPAGHDGQHARCESLFYYFKPDDYIPKNHLLRLIDEHVSFAFFRERLKDSYSDTGRPSIDPELLLRILLIGYLHGITSEGKLVEELQMHLAWRWFTVS